MSEIVTDRSGKPLARPAKAVSYTPSDLWSAYNLGNQPSGGASQTVAIVDAYDSPTAESDLATYRSLYGLGPCTSGGCFTKVNQDGNSSPLPRADSGWAQEISLDLDMVSAICPKCHILLVEANSNSFSDLTAAVATAKRLGATQISNSYGGSEYAGEDDSAYDIPGVAVTVSSGDNGYGAEFPAASPHVVAVGGTSLQKSTSPRGWSESAWSGAGSGCSAYEPEQTWATPEIGCGGNRTIADVSAVADPNTGVRVVYNGTWYVFGGTSVSAPIIASVYALAGVGHSAQDTFANADASNINDAVGGSNQRRCTTALCSGVTGFDGPTGLGTPNGTGAF